MSEYDKTSSKMQGVSTVVAMPQWYINSNLADLLKYGTTTDGKSLKDVRLSFQNSGYMWLNGTLSSLKTAVYVEGSVTKVKFILTFQSGTMDYYDISVVPPTPQNCKIDGLIFGFDVNLSHSAVDDNADLPDDVKKAVSDMLQYTGPGAFTIQHLFMDLENAVLDQYDPTVTVWSPDMPPSAIGAFPDYIRSYMAQLVQVNGNTLGYAIQVDDTASVPATFPPTSLDYVTNQYRDASGRPNTDLDTINYLMMTDNQKLPSNLQPWWGNFVVPSDDAGGWYGTMGMGYGPFIKKFMLPRLYPLVTTYWQLKDQNGTLNCGYTEQVGGFVMTGDGGTFDSGYLRSHSHVTNTMSNDDVYYGMQVTCDLKVQPGTNTIVINRMTKFDIDYIHWYGLEGHAAKDEFHVWYEVPLTITIKLLGVMDGQLQVESTDWTITPDHPYGDPYGWYIVRTSGSYSTWSTISSTTDAVIDNMCKMAIPEGVLPSVTTAIENNLNLTPFVFPGGAELFMANPVFNDECDLLLGLQYKS